MKTEQLPVIVVFDIDGVVRDVGGSYRRAIADTVERFTDGLFRPTMTDIDELKSEGVWNNDWQASQELVYRYYESQGKARDNIKIDYDTIVDFFQGRYRGTNPNNFDGYITREPLLMSNKYLEHLSRNSIGWGFFSGATRGSAEYILKQRLNIKQPILIAMEDAPGKPNPTGLFKTVQQINPSQNEVSSVIYVGDTVADMQTVVAARKEQPNINWIGVGVLPPHVQHSTEQQNKYQEKLQDSGATIVLNNVEKLDFNIITKLV